MKYTAPLYQMRQSAVRRLLLGLLTMMLMGASLPMRAQQDFINVDVTPVQPILPPQVGDYKNNPGNYFNVVLYNKTNEEQQVYLGIQLEQVMDLAGSATGLFVSTPPERQPGSPFVIEANGHLALSVEQMRRLFNHIPIGEMKFSENLFSQFGAADYGLLPEGTYRVRITAYKWDPRLTEAVALSNPEMTGFNTFQICYRAQAPQILTPTAMLGTKTVHGMPAVQFPLMNPIFTWTEPTLNCSRDLISYDYKLTIKEVLTTGNSVQSPDEAILYNPKILEVPVSNTQCMLQVAHIKKLLDGHLYVAQVTATPHSQNQMNYSMVENQGKSPLVLFTPQMMDEAVELPDLEEEGEDDLLMESIEDVISEKDSLYVFRNPQLIKPDFDGNTNHALFYGNSIQSEWKRPVFVGGEGRQQETLKFSYRAELYSLAGYATTELALKEEPIYKGVVKGNMEADEAEKEKTKALNGVDVLEDYIEWDEIQSKVSVGQTLLLRIVPECVNEESVRFYGEMNDLAFVYSEKLSDAFGNGCSGGMIEANRKPIEIAEKEMRGKTVFVGEYEMEMGDDVTLDKKNKSWSGTGWVLWEPMGQKVKVGVKFEKIYINSDYVMYDGKVLTDTKSNWDHLKERATKVNEGNNFDEWIPDDIFTEWGLDNLVGYATPDELKQYLSQYTNQAGDELNNLAQKVKASKYYDYVRKGYAVYDNFMNTLGDGKMPDIEVFLPIQLPDKVNKSPIDIQIMSMEFHPTFAWMNLLGMFSMDNDIVENEILMFGAPRVCMDPDRILPASGNIVLLEDLTLTEKDSGFEFTFKAPTNTEQPEDGCMMTWENDEISFLSLKAEMLVPDLVKVDDKGMKIEGEKPKLYIEAQVSDWEDWWASVSMDSFEAEDLPGWTFTAQDIIYDHSQKTNPKQLVFPDHYNKDHFPESKFGDNAWQGLYVGKVAVQMPEGFLKNGDKRFAIDGMDMIIDKSGVTASFGLNDPVDCSVDNWALRVKQVAINILQGDFNGCTMNGDVHVPLTDEDDYIGFTCDMIPQENEDNPGAIDFLLKIQGEENLDGKLNFDFFLADLALDNKQTYFLLEAIDQGSGQGYKTRVELCLAGDLTIGGANELNGKLTKASEKIKKYVSDLPFELRIPGVHFTEMRLANCPRSETWVHGEKTRTAAREAFADDQKGTNVIKALYENKTFVLGDGDEKFYFDCGNWSLASFEKQLGPFKFALEDYEFNQDGKTIELVIKGRIGFLMKNQKDPLVSAGASVAILAEADVKNLSFSYKDTQFRDAEIDINVAGITIGGSLAVERGTENGYKGTLKFKMPGDLFSIEAYGGYLEHGKGTDDHFSYGWFYAAAGGEALRFDPIIITKVGAGFYFNCVRKGETDATPQKGMIGAIATLGLKSTDGELVKEGEFNMTVLYDNENDRLTSMLFTGDLDAASGMVKAKASIAWVHNDEDKYFQLNVTADVKADKALDEEISKKVGDMNTKLKELNDKFEDTVQGAKAGLADAVGVKAGEGTSEEQKQENKTEDFSDKGSGMGATVSLDLKITFKQNGKNLDKCKWHVYLGEPDLERRCSLTLIDMKTGIVNVKVGANMYLCIGNELPNNGELPPIPTEISDFLNGEQKEGVVSADIYKAEKARLEAQKKFAADAEGGGGFMMGAQVYGYVDVDLGIFYGGLGVNAGFDVSIRKLAYNACPQTSDGLIGHNGWYGEGQLYAYLAAKFGIHVNLGFWKQDFDIINAGIGGVLKCGTPHPNYFIGDARVKLKLLGGLVNINRRFSFECGTRCDMFYGNPLDNFELFGDCTLGVPEMREGWGEKADMVDPGLISLPRFETQAPLDANFRVLDENSLNQLLESYNKKNNVEREQLEMQAKRTFVFRRTGSVYLYEFSSKPDSTLFNSTFVNRTKPITRTGLEARLRRMHHVSTKELTVKDYSQTTHGLQLTGSQLTKNRYYAIIVKGSAKEIIRGREDDPRTYHPEADWKGDRWTQEPWEQTQVYYFRTGEAEELEDNALLQEYVAIAYPSVRNKLKSEKKSSVKELATSSNSSSATTSKVAAALSAKSSGLQEKPGSSLSGSSSSTSGLSLTTNSMYYTYTDAYPQDVIRPTIALNSDIRNRLYQNGRLVWRLYSTQEVNGATRSTLVCEAENKYLDNAGCLNMVPSPESDWVTKATAALKKGTKFRITLNYENTTTEEYTEQQLVGYQTVTSSRSGRDNGLSKTPSVSDLTSKSKDNSAASAETVPVYNTVTKTREVVNVLAQLMDVAVTTVDGTWLTGYYKAIKTGDEGKTLTGRYFVDYSKPFMGIRVNEMKTDHDDAHYIDDNSVMRETAKSGDVPFRVIDPYWYLSYKANWYYIGGHPIKNYGFETGQDANGDAVPVSESLIYYDKGGVYAGNLDRGIRYNIQEGVKKIKQLSYSTDYSTFGAEGHQYPLPVFDGVDEWCNNLILGGQSERTPQAVASKGNLKNRYYNALWNLVGVYFLAGKGSDNLAMLKAGFDDKGTYRSYFPSQWYYGLHKKGSESNIRKVLQQWNNFYRGVYNVASLTYQTIYGGPSNPIMIQIPMYQYPLMIGQQYDPDNSKGLGKAVPSVGTRARSQEWSTKMLYMQYGGYSDYYVTPSYVKNFKHWSYNAGSAVGRITNLDMTIYRVNAFNLNTLTYDCLPLDADGQTRDESHYVDTNTSNTWVLKNWSETTRIDQGD